MIRRIEQVRFTEVAPKKKRVAAYARVSSGKDAMLHSLSAQVSYYSEYIQKHGWEYAGVYADEAITGTKDNRESFQRLLAECRKGTIQMVITKSISRFARNTVTLLETVRELKALGVGVYFEEQNIHTMSADGELMLTVLASYAQEESLSASENQKWRIQKCFQNGDMVNTYLWIKMNMQRAIVASPNATRPYRSVIRLSRSSVRRSSSRQTFSVDFSLSLANLNVWTLSGETPASKPLLITSQFTTMGDLYSPSATAARRR